MSSYQLLEATDAKGVQRLTDMAFVPASADNLDWQAYLAWKAGGNTAVSAVSSITASAVDQQCHALLTAGFSDTATGKVWSCDPQSLLDWTAIGATAGLALLSSASTTQTYTLIAADGSEATLSASQVQGLTNRLLAWVTHMKLYAQQLKAAIQSTSPPTNLATGWPTS